MEITQNLLRELFYYEDGKLFNRTKRSGGALAGEEARVAYLEAKNKFHTIKERN